MLEIEWLEKEIPVYDITVNGTGCFYANDIVVHNCQEIGLPTTPLLPIDDIDHDSSLISLCILAAINQGKFSKSLTEKEEKILRDCAQVLVRGLDSLISYQEYPNAAARRATERYRPLGIGVIGFAHWLAKGRLTWGSQETLEAVEQYMERQTYYLIEASIDLSKEFGPIEQRTKYADGILPIDTSIVPPINLCMDWDAIRKDLIQYGIRNATISAIAPTETSAQMSNETNGVEGPRDLITIKGSKDGVLPQVVPEFFKLNNHYETFWNIEVPDYLRTVASIQKFVDQSISSNTSYNPRGKPVMMSRLISDLLLSYKLGIKTLYYNNTNDGSGDNDMDEAGCESGACKL